MFQLRCSCPQVYHASARTHAYRFDNEAVKVMGALRFGRARARVFVSFACNNNNGDGDWQSERANSCATPQMCFGRVASESVGPARELI